jgi:hypothetical protein
MLLKDGVLCSIVIPADPNLSKTKANGCVSTVTSVCKHCEYCLSVRGPNRGPLSRVRFFEVFVMADTPDGPDGISRDECIVITLLAARPSRVKAFVTKRHQPVCESE